MAQKNATPSRSHQVSIRAAGLNAAELIVVKELPSQLIIINRIDGEFKMVSK